MIRTFINIVEAAHEHTEYGYWITDAGKLIPVHYDGDHYRVIRDAWDDVSPHEYETAMSNGWIRVVSYRDGNIIEFSADTYGKHTTPKALRALFRLALEFSDAPAFFYTDESLGIQKRYDNVNEFISAVRRATS